MTVDSSSNTALISKLDREVPAATRDCILSIFMAHLGGSPHCDLLPVLTGTGASPASAAKNGDL